MKEYTIVYKNKPSEEVAAVGKHELIKSHFEGDEKKFENEVSKLIWNELTMQCVLDVSENKVISQIFTADVNPYGWRNA
ncbi:hypothetical protein [Ekhidna sp.]|uniref:hypothetical protein n=1 Tax=Ekhidna sp. TaxID=2608089 RepID=UPI003CCBDB45